MKMNQHKTKNDLREKTRRAMIDLLNQELADVLLGQLDRPERKDSVESESMPTTFNLRAGNHT